MAEGFYRAPTTNTWVPYLPVYNARPCIIRIPISDQILRKKKNKLLNTKVKLYNIILLTWQTNEMTVTTSFTYLAVNKAYDTSFIYKIQAVLA